MVAADGVELLAADGVELLWTMHLQAVMQTLSLLWQPPPLPVMEPIMAAACSNVCTIAGFAGTLAASADASCRMLEQV